MENSIEVPQKTKYRTTIWSSHPTPGYVSRQNFHSERYITPVFMLLRRYGTYTPGTLSSHKKNKIMLFAATWMELEILILSELSQKEKHKYHMYHLYLESNIWHKWTFPQKRKSQTWRIDLWLPRGRGREWEGLGAWGYQMQTIALGTDLQWDPAV